MILNVSRFFGDLCRRQIPCLLFFTPLKSDWLKTDSGGMKDRMHGWFLCSSSSSSSTEYWAHA